MVDTNVLLNLATPVVDGRAKALTGADPFKALLASYDVHIPESVLGEVAEATGHDDLLSAAAELVLQAAHHLTTHEVAEQLDVPLDYGLDREESECVWLANELNARLLITDEFNTSNYLFISLALEDRNTLFTTPISFVFWRNMRWCRKVTSSLPSPTTSKRKTGTMGMWLYYGGITSGGEPLSSNRTRKAT